VLLYDLLFRWREASILVVGIGLALYFWVQKSDFVSSDNIITLTQYAAAPAILAAGEVLLLIGGEIDLSVGNIFALAPFILYTTYTDQHVPLVLGVILALVVGALAGLVNGAVTVLLKVPSFITTLGMSFLLYGITQRMTNSYPEFTPGSGTFSYILGHADYSEIIWAVAIVIVGQIMLSFTPWGLHTIAAGGNILGAREVGINVNVVKVGNFMIAGVLAAFAGILEAVRTTSTDPSAGGTNLMFIAVVAAVIGGTSLLGGSGTIMGALIGAIVLSIINDGLNLLGVNANTYFIVLGVAILSAMILNVRLQLLRRGGS
jgi:simple sugar transport system permease protein